MMQQESRLVISIDARNAEVEARNFNSQLQAITDKGNAATKQTNVLSSSLKTLTGYMAGVVTVSNAISRADAYTQMAARIRNATQSQEEYNLVQQRVLETANTTFRSLGEAQEVYLGMAGGMRSLGKSTQDTLALVDSLSFSFTHNAARADQAQSAIDAMSKSMAKGKVDADAWISIVTAADNLIADMAKTTGRTEQEIRRLGATGKISLDELIQTLIATREENERLANNMENSLADGFQKLSNEIDVFLGKANETTSATGILSAAVVTLADNLNLIANASIAVGIGYATKAILTKTLVVKASIAATLAERAATAQLAKDEVALATAKLATARASMAQATSIQAARAAKQAEAAATEALTAATLRQAAAQGMLARGAGLARGALALVGGPIGALALGVTALTAGYMYLSQRTEQANAKLAEQAQVADKTRQELEKLTGTERTKAVNDLTEAFEKQNKALQDSQLSMGSALVAIENMYGMRSKEAQIAKEARLGIISYDDALKQLNALDISPKLYESLLQQKKAHEESRIAADKSKDALKIFGVEVKLAGNEAVNAANNIDRNTDALDDNAAAAQQASKAQQDFLNNLRSQAVKVTATNMLMAKGWEKRRAEMALDAVAAGAYSKQTLKDIDKLILEENKLAKNTQRTTRTRTNATRELAKAQRDEKQTMQERLSMQLQYADAYEKIMLNESAAKARAAELFSGDELKKYTALIEKEYEKQRQQYFKHVNLEINQFRWSQERKIQYAYEADLEILRNNIEVTEAERKLHEVFLAERRDREIAEVRRANADRMREAKKANEDYAREALRTQQILSAKLKDRPMLQIGIDEQQATLQNDEWLEEQVRKHDAALRDMLITQEQHQLLVEQSMAAHEDRKEALRLEYLEKYKDLQKQQQQDELSGQSQFLNGLSSTWGMATDIMRNALGEQSRAYKNMFLMQQAFAAAQAIVSAHLAAVQTTADITLPFVGKIPAANAILGFGYAQAGMIMGQALAQRGFKTGGYTGNGGTSDVAGVVHGKEYVLNAAATKRIGVDNLDAMNRGAPVQGEVNVKIVNVFNDDDVPHAMTAEENERVILNVIKRNRTKLGI